MTMLWFALTVAGVVCWGWKQRRCVMVLEGAQRPVLTPARTLWLCGVSHHLSHLQAGVCSLLHHSPYATNSIILVILPFAGPLPALWGSEAANLSCCGWRGCPASPQDWGPLPCCGAWSLILFLDQVPHALQQVLPLSLLPWL